MSTIVANHRTEQQRCTHREYVDARLICADGREQIRSTCAACGKRDPRVESPADHPNRSKYPLVVDHPYPCDCHPDGVSELHHRYDAVDYRAYLESEQWAERRKYHLVRVFNRCQLCNAVNTPDNALQVHHRTYVRLGAEFDLDVIVLCRDCHMHHHERMAA
jgi:hypothetical protein